MSKWPCVFSDPFIRQQVNPRLAKLVPHPPYAPFQKAWREVHCKTLNPYGSRWCRYDPTDCAIAYYREAERALVEATTSPIGFFRAAAKRSAYDRSEQKVGRNDALATPDEGGTRTGDPGVQSGSGVRRGRSGPRGVGEVLRSLDPRSHPVGGEKGEAGGGR